MPAHRVPARIRLEKYSDRSGGPYACWPWLAGIGANGYAKLQVTLSSGKIEWHAHRAAYRDHFGDIPDGMTIDHRCGNRACVNPRHLAAIPIRDNVLRGGNVAAVNARKTVCKRGHRLYGDNLYVAKSGGRVCRICNRNHTLTSKRVREWGPGPTAVFASICAVLWFRATYRVVTAREALAL